MAGSGKERGLAGAPWKMPLGAQEQGDMDHHHKAQGSQTGVPHDTARGGELQGGLGVCFRM